MNQKVEATVLRLLAKACQLLSGLEKPAMPHPEKIGGTAEAVDNEMRLAWSQDDTPDLQLVEDDSELHWVDVLAVLADGVHQALAEPGAKTAPADPDAESGTAVAIGQAEALRHRVVGAIDGNKSDRKRSEMLRSRVLAGRVVHRSRASWESETKQLLAAIRELGPEAPPALRKLVQPLERMRDRLDAVRAEPGRPATQVTFSAKVEEATLALHLAFGELLSWASATATEKRYAALARIIQPKRRADTPEAPAPDATVTPETAPAPAKPATTTAPLSVPPAGNPLQPGPVPSASVGVSA